MPRNEVDITSYAVFLSTSKIVGAAQLTRPQVYLPSYRKLHFIFLLAQLLRMDFWNHDLILFIFLILGFRL